MLGNCVSWLFPPSMPRRPASVKIVRLSSSMTAGTRATRGSQSRVPLGLVAAAPLSDAIFTAPVVADGRVYVVDGSRHGLLPRRGDAAVLWKVATRGGDGQCNNVSSPALAGGYLHFGTMAGGYYVLDAATGKLVQRDRLRRADLQHARRRPTSRSTSPRWAPGCMPWSPTARSAGPGTSSRSYWFQRRSLERGRVAEAPQGPGHCRRTVLVLARHRRGRQDGGAPGGRLVVWLDDLGPRAADEKRGRSDGHWPHVQGIVAEMPAFAGDWP